jgi:hypothetical protein
MKCHLKEKLAKSTLDEIHFAQMSFVEESLDEMPFYEMTIARDKNVIR